MDEIQRLPELLNEIQSLMAKSARKRLSSHPKFYLFDTGVTNTLQRVLSAPPNPKHHGRLFEQYLILETHRLLSYHQSEARLFYWRTNTGSEVDLLLEEHGELKAAIEIKALKSIEKRDLHGLKSFHESHPKVPMYVIGEVREAYSIDKVQILPWKTYLSRLFEKGLEAF
ncbi:MAG: DUF4143 domain-containing protein [Deltaproteobacteria bacterium]|nr:DUF4143 domain-containing protein [Deltaproteobacteria bacterium]